jgi:hypothetical protein
MVSIDQVRKNERQAVSWRALLRPSFREAMREIGPVTTMILIALGILLFRFWLAYSAFYHLGRG